MDPTPNLFLKQMPCFVRCHSTEHLKYVCEFILKKKTSVIAVKWTECVFAFKRLPSIAPSCLFSSFVCCLTFTMMDTMKCGDENNDHVCFKSSPHTSERWNLLQNTKGLFCISIDAWG